MNRKLKILCLTAHDLDGPEYGAALRSRHLFRLLSRHGDIRVVLAGENVSASDKKTVGGFELARVIRFQAVSGRSIPLRLRGELNSRSTDTHPFAAVAADRDWLAAELPRYDLVWVHSLTLGNAFGLWRWPRSVLDIDDVPSTFYRSMQEQAESIAEKLRWKRQVFQWRRREKYLGERFDAISVCSEPDREILGGGKNIFTIPNGFETPKENPPRQLAMPPRLGFVGKLDYRPNREGVWWFVQNVWPQVLEKFPTARLRLVGAGTDKENWPAGKNIEPLGWLADGAGEMATWSLSIVPVLIGGGTRIKIAEAFSRRCPVVATPLGAYGYDVADGRELLLAGDANGFAEKCCRLLSESAFAEKMAGAAHEKFLQRWTWEAQAPSVAAAIQSVVRP